MERTRTLAVDVAIGVTLCALFGLEVLLNLPVTKLTWDVFGLFGLLVCAVVVSRRLPLVSFMLASAGLAYLVLLGIGTVSFTMAAMLTSYLLGRRMAGPRPAVYAFAALAAVGLGYAVVLGFVRGRLDTQMMQWLWMVFGLVLFAVFPWFAGRFVRQRAELLRAGWQRAEQLEREQRIIAERERLRERARIAQDMHDSLGHELALIALRAGGLEVDRGLDDRHRQAAGELRMTAGQASETLRTIIGLLGEPGTLAPLRPTSDSVADLVERARASGMAVDLGGDLDVTGVVGLAVRRVVQEGLTNAAKYAPGAAVAVSVERGESVTSVSVVNGQPVRSVAADGGTQRGLIGLRERTLLMGGTFAAGPEDGGFAVRVRLPHDAVTVVEPIETTESVREQVRRTARRGLIVAVGAPAAIAFGLVAVMFGYYAYSVTHSVLPRAEFDQFWIGQPKDDVEAALPEMEMLDAPTLPNPPGAGCRYYLAEPAMFDFHAPVLRVCFDADRLVAKDVVRGSQQ
ncbi:sensor histidine kinase [Actinokineospora globicatena]|uniref:sensor histidine kinase n=1 Tax=Actinokineospora globicatena TaxID=103729 RepID=UPI0020A40F47|nr:histidine kinase [Actinokineospora globicatena]MCP2304988.1 Signal transduction histidine kinase [Actinokineospora globicatena]GLW80450.1 two-component sensor histidine kinase [Actinokineospora globicatena]GLW87278.1 two-component sensor histidine kinase [Actinokineospora globicatena]